VARDGDTIILSPGTYGNSKNANLSFGGKRLTMRSKYGAARTIIDGSGLTAYTISGSDNVTLDGLTFTNCNRGLHIKSQANISNCVFKGNWCTEGGAVMVDLGARAVIGGSIFQGCQARKGGAVANMGGTLTISQSTFQGNRSDWDGAGVYALGPTVIDHCSFRENRSDLDAAAVFVGHDVRVSNSMFLGNKSARWGGAICVGIPGPTPGTLKMENSVFVGNTADNAGGTEYGYTAADAGGALWSVGLGSVAETMRIVNSTFVNNGLGSIRPRGSCTTIINSIVRDDNGKAIKPITINGTTTNISVSNSNVSGGFAGQGNFDADPLFVRQPGDLVYPYGDLHLLPGSPCRNMGSDSGLPTIDLDDQPRIEGSHADMGAYENQPTSRFQNCMGTYFVIYNADSRLVLQDNGIGTQATQADYSSAKMNQQWLVVPIAGQPGNYRIVNRGTGADLDVFWISTADDAVVGTNNWNGGWNQTWALPSLGNWAHSLVSLNSGKLLQTPGSSPYSGAGLTQHSDTGVGSNNQQWILVQYQQ